MAEIVPQITPNHNIDVSNKFAEYLQCAKYYFKWFTYNNIHIFYDNLGEY